MAASRETLAAEANHQILGEEQTLRLLMQLLSYLLTFLSDLIIKELSVPDSPSRGHEMM